ncbi:MAG: hypothetical protein ABIH92_03680 [Nanoarchaeota archaeon]
MDINLKLKNLEARRFVSSTNPLNINNNSTVTSLSATTEVLNVGFIFTSNYEPNIGLIRIEGDLEISNSGLKASQVVEEWETSGRKTLPREVAEKIHNSILSTCMVEATILSRDIHLPSPIPTPRIAIEGANKGKSEDTNTYIR